MEFARAVGEDRVFAKFSAIKALSLAGVLVSALVSFSTNGYPLLFVPFVAVVIATFALRTTGAITGIVILAVIGTVATAYGSGPVIMAATQTQDQIAFLQFYLLMILICVLPVGSMLDDRHRDAVNLKRSNRLLAKAESLAHVGHWRFAVGAQEVLWSAEVYRIYGLEPGDGFVPLETAMGAYHPDDREIVMSAVERASLYGEEFQFEARIVQPDGSVRHVRTHGEVECVGGRPSAVFGVFLDITEQKSVIEQLSAAHREAQRNAREARRLAETDQLTGVANRRRLMNELEAAIDAADADAEPSLSFLMIDVDDFKIINDTCGHPVGDAVLARIAQIATGCLRTRDLVGRMGGEEFGIILRDADRHIAATVAERIRAGVEQEDFDELDRVSISIGVAQHVPGADMTWLIQSADTALYVAKRSGKNRLRFAA
jgi:diguanylate cyclase (GGDEF)-like protein